MFAHALGYRCYSLRALATFHVRVVSIIRRPPVPPGDPLWYQSGVALELRPKRLQVRP